MATGDKKAYIDQEELLEVGRTDVSSSTDRRYSQVVQEYMKKRMIKSDSERSNVSPSQVLSEHADKAGPREGSYVSWECPDTPHSRKSAASKNVSKERGTPVNPFVEDPDTDPSSFHSLNSMITSTGNANRTDTTYFVSPNNKTFYSLEEAFKNTDPFESSAENVVSLTFNSQPSLEEVEMKTPTSSVNGSSVSVGSGEGTEKKKSHSRLTFVYPSPDKNWESKQQSPVLKSFSKINDESENGDSQRPPSSPTESQNSSVNHHKPCIWITSVHGSSHNLLDGKTKKEESPQRIPSWTGAPTPPVERKSRRQHETRMQLESMYPPEEISTRSYTFNQEAIPSSGKVPQSVETSSTSVQIPSPSPNLFPTEDLYYDHDVADFLKQLDRKEKLGNCLIIFGLALFISSVIVILVTEIPAHFFQEEEYDPDSKPFFDYMEAAMSKADT